MSASEGSSRRGSMLGPVVLGLALAISGCAHQQTVPAPQQNAVPLIASVAPPSVVAGGAAFTITVDGVGFVTGASVQWNGANRSTTLVSTTQLRADIGAQDVARAGTINVTVFNPAPGGGTSAASIFIINNPAPKLPTISPTAATAGDAGVTITASGTGFVQESVIRWNGADRTTTYVNATELRASITAGDLGAPGTATIAVFNPGPGGGVSETMVFTIRDPIQSAPPGTAMRASVSRTGGDSNGASYDTAISSDGRYIAFASAASNLVDNDGNPDSDVYLADSCLGAGGNCTPARSLMSLASTGGAADGGSFEPAVSRGGRYVAFYSFGSNLVAGDTNDKSDIFVRDTCLGATGACTPKTARVSVSSGGEQGDGAAFDPVITPDGRFVTFRSSSSNLVANDQNGADDIFVHDRDADGNGVFDEPGAIATTRVSLGLNGEELGNSSSDSAISVNGRYVAFLGDSAGQGVVELMVRDTCQEAPAGCTPGTTLIALVNSDSEDADPRPPSMSADGRYVAFSSFANDLVNNDNNFSEDVFLRDTCAGAPAGCTPSTIRISMNDNDDDSDGDSLFPSISQDGRYVAFQSNAVNLVSNDTNNASDVFARDTCLGGPAGCKTKTVRVSVATDGTQGNDHSFDPALSADGRIVAFSSTASSLVTGDGNNVQDIFVAITGLNRDGNTAAAMQAATAPSVSSKNATSKAGK